MQPLAIFYPNEVMERLLGYRGGILRQDAGWLLAGFRPHVLILLGLAFSILFPFMLMMGVVVSLIAVIKAARIATMLTAQHVSGDQLQLLRLTHVSEGEIVRGYILAAVYRVRGSISGLTVAILSGLVGMGLCASSTGLSAGSMERYTFALLALLLLVIGLTGMTFTAAALGVSAALHSRGEVTIIAVTLLAVVALIMLPVGLTLASPLPGMGLWAAAMNMLFVLIQIPLSMALAAAARRRLRETFG